MLNINEKIDDEIFFEICALLLSINRKNFETMLCLDNFHNMTKKLTNERIENLNLLSHLQYTIIKHLLKNTSQSNIKHLHDSLNYLHDEGLTDKLSMEKLISLFDPSMLNETKEQEISSETINEDFHSDKQSILMDVAELIKVYKNSDELGTIVEYLNNQKFSIGITGVMNAGKSTMLNALIGKEILGTNVIPETANLTVVKYSHTPFAKVVYWDKSEWLHIQNSAKSIEAMDTFVKQTTKHFKKELDSYILDVSLEEIIDIEDLSSYTSASTSEKKCNLVKYVELGQPLHFLQDNIEIVDTPGLDDIVIQREEITKEYLSKCDVMIHLMNVSQSATIKDIEFIIDAVLYQNITKVLIVITRIDMVTPEDVQEVIAYTKKSISNKLHEQNSESKLDFVLQSLEFIPLSAKMALLNKTGHSKEAEDAGFSLEKSGILEIEEYLNDTLFGKQNSRSSLIIRSAKNRISKVISSALQELKYENSLLFKTKDEVNIELDILKIKKSRQSDSLERLKHQIAGYESEISDYLQRLQHYLENELKALQNVIKQRLMDETTYSLQKDKKTPSTAAHSRIIQAALKHGLIDIIREYRYKFIKKSSKVFETITLQYDEITSSDENIHSDFEYKSIFNDAFNHGFVTANNENLISKVSKVLKSVSSAKLDKTDAELGSVIKEEFIYLEKVVKEKAISLSQELLEEFFTSLKEPINTFENNLDHYEELLKRHILLFEEDEAERSKKSIQLNEVIKSVESIAKRYNI